MNTTFHRRLRAAERVVEADEPSRIRAIIVRGLRRRGDTSEPAILTAGGKTWTREPGESYADFTARAGAEAAAGATGMVMLFEAFAL